MSVEALVRFAYDYRYSDYFPLVNIYIVIYMIFMKKISPEACRAARAILKWSMVDLSKHANIAFSTVNLLEGGKPIRLSTSVKIVEAFKREGVEIISDGAKGAKLIDS